MDVASLLMSHNFRTLFRTFSNPIQRFAQSWGDWSIEVLRHWESAKVSFLEHPATDPPNRAVNSRDNTASLPSTKGSIARLAAVGAESEAHTYIHPSCSSRFKTWRQMRRHLQDVHRLELESRKVLHNGGPTTKHRCERINPLTGKSCGVVFFRAYDLTRH